MILSLAVCCLGVSAFITQLTLLRELLSVFAGNELVLGIVLGNWMLLTGLGATLGKAVARLRRPPTALIVAQILVAVLPIADVFLLRALRNVVFLRGAEVGVIETVASCFVLLAPYCLALGGLLTGWSMFLGSGRGTSSIGQVYSLDNTGSMIGGVLFSFVLIYLFDHFGILYIPAVLNLVCAGLVAARLGRPVLLSITAVVAAAMVVASVAFDLDALSTRMEYAGQNVVYHGDSPYGRLVVTEAAGQHNFMLNGVPLCSTNDMEEVEQTVHYAMAQRPDAQRVLLISGGISGTAREVLKYGVAAVDYVEIDLLVISVARRFLPAALADERIHVIASDGRLFIKQTPQRYDVVVVDVPDPSTSQLNRFYTREFYGEVKRVLKPDGVLSFTLGHYENWLGGELAELLATGHRTATEAFSNLLLVPDERSGRVFFLASDGDLTAGDDPAGEIAARLQKKRIFPHLITPSYLRAVFSPDRVAAMRRVADDDAPVNTDFSPILYFHRLRLWMSQFKIRFGLFEALLLVILAVYLARIRPIGLGVFAGGFAASALEVILLMGFQIIYGSVYQQVGIIITMFMLGLGIGSVTMNRLLARFGRRDLAWLGLAIAVYAACLPAALIGLGKLGGGAALVAAQAVVPLLALLLAVLVGMEFPLAGKAILAAGRTEGDGADESSSEAPAGRRYYAATPAGRRCYAAGRVASTAAQLYTADYVGGALGALLVSTLLIPLIGVTAVCLLTAGLNVVSSAVILGTSRN